MEIFWQKELADFDTESPVQQTGFAGRTSEEIKGTPSIHISKIKIKNFKAISEVEVSFPRISILTGPNNSGKSTILQAISLGFECLTRNVDRTRGAIKEKGTIVQEASTVPVNQPKHLWHNNKWVQNSRDHIPIEIRIDLTNGSYFTSQINYNYGNHSFKIKEYSPDLKDINLLKKIINSNPVLIPGIPGILRHEQPQLPSVMTSILNYGLNAQVLRNVLMRINKDGSDKFKSIKKAIGHHFNIDLSDIPFDENFNLEIVVPYKERDIELEIISGGSGFHQILQILSLLSWNSSSIVLLDEPDSHLHTSLQKKLYLFLDDLSKKLNIQLIISTHSRDFLAASPLHSIIPVDLSRPVLKPMESVEHLLSEYKRQGEISNLDLVALYNSKSCLFVEGPDDEAILAHIADKMDTGIVMGKNVITMPFNGKDKINMLPDLVNILRRITGTDLKWFVLRDSDGLAPEILKEFEKKLGELDVKDYHIWNKHEIENYLCDAKAVVRLLNLEGKTVPEADIDKLIVQCCIDVLEKHTAHIIVDNQNKARSVHMPNPLNEGADTALSYLNDAKQSKNKDKLLKVTPGKEVLGKLIYAVQNIYGIQLTPHAIAREIRADEMSMEVHDVFKKMSLALL